MSESLESTLRGVHDEDGAIPLDTREHTVRKRISVIPGGMPCSTSM